MLDKRFKQNVLPRTPKPHWPTFAEVWEKLSSEFIRPKQISVQQWADGMRRLKQ